MNFRKIYEQAKLLEKYGKRKNKITRRLLRESVTVETVQDAINDLHEIIHYGECSLEVFESAKKAQRVLFLLGNEIGMDVYLSPVESSEN
jgi:hypothetical protein